MNDNPPINGRFPLIVVKRCYYDEYEAGRKTIEYRLHRAPFTRKAYYPGRWVRIAPNFNIKLHPSLIARVLSFDVMRAGDPCLSQIQGARASLERVYPDLSPDAELALIGLRVYRGAGSARETG
jgi:hypothetical protein